MNCMVSLVTGLCLSSALRYQSNCFPKCCTRLHSLWLYMSVPIASCLFQLSVLLAFQISWSGKLCIYLVSNQVEELFIYVLAIWISSFVKLLFKSASYFFFLIGPCIFYCHLEVLYLLWNQILCPVCMLQMPSSILWFALSLSLWCL